MKKVVLVFLFAVMTVGGVFAQQGASSVGLSVGYALDSDNTTVGIDYRYNVSDDVRIAPSLTHLMKHGGLSAWALDFNAHYVVKLDPSFGFYPLGGVSLSFWEAGRDWDATRFGVNIGLGGEVYASRDLTVGLEMKYNLIQDFDQAMAAVRIAYNF